MFSLTVDCTGICPANAAILRNIEPNFQALYREAAQTLDCEQLEARVRAEHWARQPVERGRRFQ